MREGSRGNAKRFPAPTLVDGIEIRFCIGTRFTRPYPVEEPHKVSLQVGNASFQVAS